MIDTRKQKDLMLATGTALFNLEQHECSSTSLASVIAVMLMHFHYNKLDSYSAAFEVTKLISDEFADKYWELKAEGKQMVALISIIETAEYMIASGKISKETKDATQKTIEENPDLFNI